MVRKNASISNVQHADYQAVRNTAFYMITQRGSFARRKDPFCFCGMSASVLKERRGDFTKAYVCYPELKPFLRYREAFSGLIGLPLGWKRSGFSLERL